ncbi:MAG: DmsE family decaheme c-type cytochrome [Lysobacteraceae bacterium]
MAVRRWSTLFIVTVALMAGLLLAAPWPGGPAGQAMATPVDAAALPGHVRDCLTCHGEPHVEAILLGPHGVAEDPRTGFAERGCAVCHGPSQAHMDRPARGERRAPPDVVFSGYDGPPTEANAMCLACHQSSAGLHWQGSVHEVEDLACSSCHASHVVRDPVLDPAGELLVCASCHARTHAEALRPSAHPLLDGQMACSDCHAPHGGTGPALLSAPTVNQSCTGCHAEFRGPFLWEHPPAAEDCMACHQPHGSVHRPLLVKRTPWLCQDCHMAQFHPSAALSGTGLPGEDRPSGSQSMLGRDCMNCHVHVHGTNHPSGAGTTR